MIALKIPAISCGHCIRTITMELKELQGVKEVSADLATKLVTVDFDDPATEVEIRNLLKDINYPADEG